MRQQPTGGDIEREKNETKQDKKQIKMKLSNCTSKGKERRNREYNFRKGGKNAPSTSQNGYARNKAQDERHPGRSTAKSFCVRGKLKGKSKQNSASRTKRTINSSRRCSSRHGFRLQLAGDSATRSVTSLLEEHTERRRRCKAETSREKCSGEEEGATPPLRLSVGRVGGGAVAAHPRRGYVRQYKTNRKGYY